MHAGRGGKLVSVDSEPRHRADVIILTIMADVTICSRRLHCPRKDCLFNGLPAVAAAVFRFGFV